MSHTQIDRGGTGASAEADRATHEPSPASGLGHSVSVPSAVRGLLAEIARIASDYDLDDVVYDTVTLNSLADYYIWQDSIALAQAYGRGEEDHHFAELAAAYCSPEEQAPLSPSTGSSAKLASTIAGHASGPWIVVDNSWEISTVYDADDKTVATCPIDDDVCEESQAQYEPIKEANARLIASAPDLLDALKPFAAVAQHDIGDDEADSDLFRPIRHNHAPLLTVGHLRAALAAIAKATGETL
jgi:hypothetical protein